MDASTTVTPAPAAAFKVRILRTSLAFRLAFLYGLAVVLVMVLVSATFYDGTVGVLGRGIDRQLTTMSNRLAVLPHEALVAEIERLLNDGIASDTEIFLLAHRDGAAIAGNSAAWAWSDGEFGRLSEQPLLRLGRPTTARVLPVLRADGDVLVVGRDMPDQHEIRRMVARALITGGVVAFLVAVLGALLFHHRVEQRLATIRHTAARIESGQWNWRIPVDRENDEFSRLDTDINRMLDHIQSLMDGARDVSNAIAHDLRTPLSRLRGRLDDALRHGDAGTVQEAATQSIADIDRLIALFDRLLQIAEAESGIRRQSFAPCGAAELLSTIAELYDATAEARSAQIQVKAPIDATLFGDRALLSAMLANLVENALKYAKPPATITLSLVPGPEQVEILVEDDGPGIPATERERVLERFYRLDRSRSQPGNGLGLSLAAAVVALHEGRLSLEDAGPGLRVRISLPRGDSFQNLSKA
jgi:signal transduction histidine kinase